MIQMSVFMLVLIYISGKIWVRCRERWEFHWPYRCFRCCIRSNDARDDNDDDVEADVLCYLCNKKVPSDEWNNSETGHRRYCAVRSKDNRGKITWCWKDIHICISLEWNMSKQSKLNELILKKLILKRKVNELISTTKKIDERLIIFKQKDFEWSC